MTDEDTTRDDVKASMWAFRLMVILILTFGVAGLFGALVMYFRP